MSPTATTRTAFRTCPLCEATCGLAITLEDGEVTRVQGDDEDVFSHGYICPKGAVLGDLDADRDRLRAPLVRGEDGELHEASWAEAFAAVDALLRPVIDEHGGSAIGVYLGNPNVHNLAGGLYVKPFVKTLRTRNVFSASTVDQMPKHVSSGLLFGDPLAIPVPDVDRTDWLLMLGANPLMSNGSLFTAPDLPGRLRALRERGGRLIVVDPRRTRTADAADEHVAIRPGTDAWLLAGMAHTLFDEGLVDLGDLDVLVNGVDEVARAVKPFDPASCAEACGVPAEVIRRLARELAAAERGVVYGRIGTTTVSFGTLTSWLVDVCNVLTGNLDRPGGAMFSRAAHVGDRSGRPAFTTGRWRSRVRDLPEVLSELPVATLADEIETPGDGQIRALFTIAGNPVVSTPNGDRLDRGLAGLEVMVCVDPYLNETTRHADVILPPPTTLERSHYDIAFTGLAVRNVANYSPPVRERGADQPDEWEILLRLGGIASGLGPDVDAGSLDDYVCRALVELLVQQPSSPIHGRDPDEIMGAVASRSGPERLLDVLLRTGPYGDGFGDGDGLTLATLEANPHGVDLGPLTPRLPGNLATDSRKVELAPPTLMADLTRLAGSAANDDGRLLLVGRRHVRTNNSWMHNVPALAKGRPLCTLQVHPDDAARLALEDGRDATISSAVGRVVAPVEVTDRVMAGVVSLPHGFGHDVDGVRLSVAATEQPGVNSNVLSDEQAMDPLSGTAVLNAIPVEVAPA